jgi:hypothetical protein
MIAVVDPEPATTVLVGEGHAPVMAVLLGPVKALALPVKFNESRNECRTCSAAIENRAAWRLAAHVSLAGVGCTTSAAAMIEFDLTGRKLVLDEQTVRELRERALAGAGSSSTLNDLAVILTRALSEPKQVTLRRAESRALERLLEAPL